MSNKKYILILIILILGLGFLSFWQFKKFSQSLTKVELPKIEMPEMKFEEFLPLEKESLKEWASPDGKLKLKYPANWIESSEALLEQFKQEEMVLAGAKILFFAYQFSFETQALAFLIVEEISQEKSLNEIVKEIEKNIAEEKGEMEVINLEKENKTAWLEIKMKRKGEVSFQAKEKIIFLEDKTYLIAFTTFEKDWPKFEEEANEIFNSIEIIQ